MPIQVLAEEVIAQIAAGEVVERPASVVKELVENALDAGAGNVRVSVLADGRRMIRVTDDGSGIPSGEVELAFTRHATSKLRSVEDLSYIQTLGFRGEALASIASVSQLSITTRHVSEAAGTVIRLEGGRLLQQRSVGAPKGTVITVENLFFNTPARLKFLKTENTEKRQIAAVVMRYAMAYPEVRFMLEQDGRELFRTNGSGQLADVIVMSLGLDEFKNMVEVVSEDAVHPSGIPIKVWGYTSMPNLNRADRTRITFFVNRRWVQDSSLTYAVVQAYHTLLMTGRYPIAALLIELPPEEVDVNVHPTKAEVRFRDADALFSAVQRAVRRAVIDQAHIPPIPPPMPGAFDRWAADARRMQWGEGHNSSYRSGQMPMQMPMDGPGQPARRQYEEYSGSYDPTAIPAGLGAPATPRTLPMLRVVGQVAATYIVAEGPAGMYLIDQHAAHERVVYERMMAEHARHETVAQQTLDGQTIQFSPPDARLVEDNLEVLRTLGFDLEPFGPNIFAIRSIPALLADADPVELVGGIADDLAAGSEPGQASIEDRIITRVCKFGSVKGGQILSLEQMKGLIQQLERCQSPLTCPHGRPTVIHMSSDELARRFGRT